MARGLLSQVARNAKPDIIGTKLPVECFYKPAKYSKKTVGQTCWYYEDDLDIAASAAARKILFTQSLLIGLMLITCCEKYSSSITDKICLYIVFI